MVVARMGVRGKGQQVPCPASAHRSPEHAIGKRLDPRRTTIEAVFRLPWTRFVVLALSAQALLCAADGPATNNIPVLTVCQALRDPSRYASQEVIIVGRSVGTDEGTWLDENCGLKVLIQGRTFTATISTTYVASEVAPPPQLPRGFKWDQALLQRALDEVRKTTRLDRGTQWAAIYGRLEAAPVRNVTLGDGRVASTFGYGHLNGAPAQLVGPADGFRRLKGK